VVFKFRLQTLLKHKERQEKSLQLDLAALREAHRQECLVLTALEEEQKAQQRLLRERQTMGRLDIPAIGLILGYMELLQAKEASQRDAIAILEQKIERRREELVAVMRERKTIEKLRERQYESYLLDQKRLESKVTDEISMSQYNRRAR